MQTLLEKYFAVNPKRLNPFNHEHHSFIPSADPDADAAYLARVEAGEVERFYVTLVELCNKAGRYEVVCHDGYNGNTLFSAPIRSNRALADNDEVLLVSLQAAIETAARHGLAFRPDLAVAFSPLGKRHLATLERYAAGEPESDWVSWTEVAHG